MSCQVQGHHKNPLVQKPRIIVRMYYGDDQGWNKVGGKHVFNRTRLSFQDIIDWDLFQQLLANTGLSVDPEYFPRTIWIRPQFDECGGTLCLENTPPPRWTGEVILNCFSSLQDGATPQIFPELFRFDNQTEVCIMLGENLCCQIAFHQYQHKQ